ncbi:MAG: hypothetical protein H0U72_02705 [Nitrosospira sp.]|nr:hypothetical protein [Nitrosospira sp.]
MKMLFTEKYIIQQVDVLPSEVSRAKLHSTDKALEQQMKEAQMKCLSTRDIKSA